MKKTVLTLDVHDNKHKRKAFKAVSCLSGIDSISMDMKERKLTVVGAVDPVDIVKKLKMYCLKAVIFSVDAPQKEGGGGGGEKNNIPNLEQIVDLQNICQSLHKPHNHCCCDRCVVEYPPNPCVIL